MKSIFSYSFAAILLAGLFSLTASADPIKVITHKVEQAETPWFLAQIFYGNGAQFTKLLKSNGWTRPEEMKEGMEIRIEDPKYSNTDPAYLKRYAALWEKRSIALGSKIDNRLPSSKVVIPTQNIRKQDNTPKLPFTEVRDTGKSTQEMANEELQLRPRKESQKKD